MTDLSSLRVNGLVAHLTLHRPDARNALSIALLEALHARLDEFDRLRTVPLVVVLAGEGKSFCAGMDLNAILNDPAAPGRLLSLLAEFTLRLRVLPAITIARVQGAAIGGGCGLACVCDFALTHADSKMGFPEVDLGVCPAVVAPWLVRRVGAGRARQILLAGGLMTGQQAFEQGIVTHVVATPAELDGVLDALASRIASGGPQALRATKSLLNQLDGSTDAELVRRGAELSARVIAMPETMEKLKAKLGG